MRSTSARVSASSCRSAASSAPCAVGASGVRTRSLTVVCVISAIFLRRGIDGIVTPRSQRETVMDSTPSWSASCFWVRPAPRRATRRRAPTPPVSVLTARSYHRARAAAHERGRARGDDTAVQSLKGHLLVAGPTLVDPNFRRTVVLVGEHSEEGAMGVVLTRPSEATVVDALPELGVLVQGPAVVHVGGPVQPSAIVVLAEF